MGIGLQIDSFINEEESLPSIRLENFEIIFVHTSAAKYVRSREKKQPTKTQIETFHFLISQQFNLYNYF